MFKKVLIGAVAVALASGTAYAGDNKLTKEEGTGMATGAAAGALVGGPIGAMVGLMIGGIVGDSIGTAKRGEKTPSCVPTSCNRSSSIRASRSRRRASARAATRCSTHWLRACMRMMFRTGTAELDVDVQKKIGDLGQLLGSHPQLEIQLHGFADPRGKSGEEPGAVDDACQRRA